MIGYADSQSSDKNDRLEKKIQEIILDTHPDIWSSLLNKLISSTPLSEQETTAQIACQFYIDQAEKADQYPPKLTKALAAIAALVTVSSIYNEVYGSVLVGDGMECWQMGCHATRNSIATGGAVFLGGQYGKLMAYMIDICDDEGMTYEETKLHYNGWSTANALLFWGIAQGKLSSRDVAVLNTAPLILGTFLFHIMCIGLNKAKSSFQDIPPERAASPSDHAGPSKKTK